MRVLVEALSRYETVKPSANNETAYVRQISLLLGYGLPPSVLQRINISSEGKSEAGTTIFLNIHQKPPFQGILTLLPTKFAMMDVRVQAFVQRTIRKISSWNFKKLQTRENPQIGQCLVLQEAIETLESPPREQITNNISALQEAVTTLDIAAAEEKSQPDQPEPQDGFQYTDEGDWQYADEEDIAAVEEESQTNLSGPQDNVKYTDEDEIAAIKVEENQTDQQGPQDDMQYIDENEIAAVEEENQIINPEPQNDLQYTDGEARIIGAHDGFRNCFALLLNEDMVSKLQAITVASRRLNLIESDFEDAKLQATLAEVNMNQIQDSLEAIDNEEEANQIKAAIEQEESRLRQANEKRDDLDFDVTNLKLSLEASRAYSHDLFERVLGEANLLAITEPQPEAFPSAPQTPVPISRRNSTVLSQSSQSSISSEECNRRAVREEVELTTHELQKLEFEFYYRREKYEQEREVWRQEVQEGVCHFSETVFDNACLADQFQLTRNLIEAEEARDDAVSRAWKLGVLQNSSETSSHFIDDVDDGYSLSLETSMKATVDRGFINDWANGVSESRDIPTLRLDNEDESCDAQSDSRSVGLSESFSIVDESRNQKRIRHWEETCEIQRRESERLRRETMGPEIPERPEELGPITRRHSYSA